MNVNQVMLVGHTTKEPEIKEIGGDSKVATIRLAVNRSYKKGDKWVDKPTFIDCEAWNQKAEYIEKSVGKGTEVYIRGRLETDEWTAKDSGEKRSKIKVYVLEMQVGKNRKDAEAPIGASAGSDSYNSESIDDLPF
jgi:single-strand DNA-binding protein